MTPTSNSPGNVTSGGSGVETSDRQSSGSSKKKKKKSASTNVTSFVGKCADIKEHVYDVGGNRGGFDLFVKTTREIAEYVSSKLKDASEFRNAMDPDNLAFETLTAPVLGDAPTLMDIEIWKITYKAHSEAVNRRELLLGQVFAIVLGQCSPTVVDRLKANADWNAVNNGNDLMGLLRLIRTSMYTGATSKNPIQSLLEAQTKFFSFRQGSRMSNAEYLRNFTALSDQVVHLHGEFGTDQAYVTARIREDGDDPDDVDIRANMTLTIREEYLAMLFFVHSDTRRFGSLVANAQNDFVGGVDKYPKTVNKAYDMLVNYVNPNKSYNVDDQDAGMSFYQEGGTRNPGRGGGNRNNPGGRGGCRNASGGENPDDNHANVEEQDTGSANDNSTNPNAYSDVSFNISSVEQIVLVHTLPRMWLLLDSCSTTDIFANKSLLTNVHKVTTPIWVRCNAGRIQLTEQGYFGNYPHPVWYNPKGVANILSLANVTKYYRVTMDSSSSPSMTVHRSDNTTIPFEPSGNGLYKHELPSDTSAVNNMWSLLTNSIPTVSDKAANYSKRAYQQAVAARRLQNIVMRPASKKYKEVILDYLRDAKVTRADIDAADDIFGPNIGALRGKTVRRPNLHVQSGVDAVPHEVIKLHKHITLTIDLMFVNNLPFFVTKSRDLHFTTIEFMKNRQVATVHENLQSVIKLYMSRGFVIDTIFADHEFEVLRPWHPNLNTAAADEHVPDIERHIRTIKDSTRSTYRTLPFIRRLPRIALIHLVKNAVFWLNAVPTNDGITRRFSPRYILTGQHILASKHAVIPFGAYVQTHEQHTNDMGQRTLSCICLGPTGNVVQGGHWFMSLTSGENLIRHRWTELPMPREAITRVNNIGKTQKMPTMLTYSNRYGAELPETIDDYPSDSETDDSDDDTYSQPDDSDDDSILSADTDASDDNSNTSEDSDSSDDDDDAAPLPPPPPPPPNFNNHPFTDTAANQEVWPPGVGDYEFAPAQGNEDNNVDIQDNDFDHDTDDASTENLLNRG